MMLAGWLFCKVRATREKCSPSAGARLPLRVIDAFADVYEGRLQQMDKLYLAGISQALRCVSGVVVFSVVLFVTRSIPVASIALAIVAAASLVIVTIRWRCSRRPSPASGSCRRSGRSSRSASPRFSPSLSLL